MEQGTEPTLWNKALGPHYGTRHWAHTMEQGTEPTSWDKALSPHHGTRHWATLWNKALSPHHGTRNKTHTKGQAAEPTLWNKVLNPHQGTLNLVPWSRKARCQTVTFWTQSTLQHQILTYRFMKLCAFTH